MSIKHHYLPQFYLKGFVNKDEKLHYCRKQYETYRDSSTAGIYYENNLNNIDFGKYGQIDLEKDFFFEKDNRYALAFSDMRNKYGYDINAMPLQTKADIVEFVLGLYWRVPKGYSHVNELIDNDGLLTGDLQLYNSKTNKYCKDEDIPDIISDIKSKIENQKAIMPQFYVENVRKHDWQMLNDKFYIWETSKPMIIGDIPYIPIKSECKRGKILEEFIIPLDRNHLLVYALDKPTFFEENLYQAINLSIIDGASEKISCNDIDFLKNEMKFAKNRIERLKILGIENASQYLALFLRFQSRFETFEDFTKWHSACNFTNASKTFFYLKGL